MYHGRCSRRKSNRQLGTEGSDNCSGIDVDDDRYYAAKDGSIVKNAIISKWGSQYLFDEDGKLLKGFNDYNGATYYSNKKGVICRQCWIDAGQNRYYAKADGHLAKNETIKKWGKKYTFDENGKLK